MKDQLPRGFQVERQNGEIIIRWGARKQIGDLAQAGVLVALALLLWCVFAEQPSIPIVFGVPLLGWAFLLVGRQFNHTTIRASSTRWSFKWGPVPARGPHVQWTSSGKTVDVARYSQVCSLKAKKQKEEEYRWRSYGSGSIIVGLLIQVPLNLIRAHLHAKNSARIRYDVFVMDEVRMGRKVLSGLSGEQAEYLVQVLQPLLARGRSASETAAVQEDVPLDDHVGVSGPARMDGARSAVAAQQADVASESQNRPILREIGSVDSEIVCPACGASNPLDSDFCGECGAPMGLGPGRGSREAHNGGTS